MTPDGPIRNACRSASYPPLARYASRLSGSTRPARRNRWRLLFSSSDCGTDGEPFVCGSGSGSGFPRRAAITAAASVWTSVVSQTSPQSVPGEEGDLPHSYQQPPFLAGEGVSPAAPAQPVPPHSVPDTDSLSRSRCRPAPVRLPDRVAVRGQRRVPAPHDSDRRYRHKHGRRPADVGRARTARRSWRRRTLRLVERPAAGRCS